MPVFSHVRNLKSARISSYMILKLTIREPKAPTSSSVGGVSISPPTAATAQLPALLLITSFSVFAAVIAYQLVATTVISS